MVLSGLCGLLVPLAVEGGGGLRIDLLVGCVTPLKWAYPWGDTGGPGVVDVARSLGGGSGEGRPSSDMAEEISLLAVAGRVAMYAMQCAARGRPAYSGASGRDVICCTMKP